MLRHYTTTDTLSEVVEQYYFNSANYHLRVGDMIMANTDTDGTPNACIILITKNEGGIVTVSNITPKS